MAERLRIGIIGAGWWAAHAHAPALKATGRAEIVAACRRSPDRLREFAEKVGVPRVYLSHEEMLDSEELDAAIVCTPHALHYAHIQAALQRGLHVLTDKPLALRYSEAQELIELAESQDRLLAVYFGPAYESGHRYAAAAIREGRLGRIVHAEAAYFANPNSLGFFGSGEFPDDPAEYPILPTQFRADPSLGGGGYLQDVGNHAFSALLIGTGLRVAEVAAVMDRPELDLRTTVSLRFEGGATGAVTVGGDVRPPVEGYWGAGHFAVYGDLGGLWRGPADDSLRRQRWGAPDERVPDSELPAPTNPDENFVQAIFGEAALIAPAAEAAECVRAIEAAYESARTGRAIHLNPSKPV